MWYAIKELEGAGDQLKVIFACCSGDEDNFDCEMVFAVYPPRKCCRDVVHLSSSKRHTLGILILIAVVKDGHILPPPKLIYL